jgi:hypothetical protein
MLRASFVIISGPEICRGGQQARRVEKKMAKRF